MIIGIELKPREKGEMPVPSVFYCGTDGVAFRRAHAALMEANETSRFYQINNPLLTPLQNVTHSTEDHPDQIAAQKRREQLAEDAKKKSTPSQPGLPGGDPKAAQRAELASQTKPQLIELVNTLNLEPGREKKITRNANATKEQIINAILAAS